MTTGSNGGFSRRAFLQYLGLTSAAACGSRGERVLGGLAPAAEIGNPLDHYPLRDWEQVYRDQYRYDRSFTWICAPNDTHMCRMRGFVRNGVLIRSEQNYDHDRCGDLYGNKASAAWNPRGCPKGYTFQRRVYGPYRLKGPVVRAGWKQWADEGFPSLSDDPSLRSKFKFDDRGNDTFVRMSWDEVARYAARGIAAIARTYSGDEGAARLKRDGYEPEMLDQVQGAGTRTMKIGSSLPIHGMVGKFGLFRFANMLGLVDHHVRNKPAEEALGPREWTEYTWRGDQAPGQPFVHGLQTSDCDMADMRYSKLTIHIGKNLVENKMADSHWFAEMMERGGRIVVITPDYSAPSAKADYWIGCRPGLSDTAILLGITKILMDNNWVDGEYVRRFTDMPLLVRTDTLARLRPQDVIPGYELADLTKGPSFVQQAMTPEQRERIGDFTVWDEKTNSVAAVSRDDVGDVFAARGLDPALEGTHRVKLVNGRTVEVMPVYEMYKRHLKDYDLATVADISGSNPRLIARLAADIWETTKAGYPVSLHHGEGTNHYFHATLHNRACHLPLMLTGNIGKHGAGVFTWAGNYKGALLQASPWTGPGVGAYSHEDPFAPVVDPNARFEHHEHLRNTTRGEDVAFWGHGERPLVVNTSRGRKVFTGATHMPGPTKLIWYNNANLINQAKWVYNLIVNVFPKVDMIVDQQVEWTGSAEYSDIVLPANSWVEFEDLELGASCSNPFVQIWGGNGIKPLHDSRDDAAIFATVSKALAEEFKDERFNQYWKFVNEKRSEVYIQRVLNACMTTRGEQGAYQVQDIVAGKHGEPGAALLLFRTYPRVAFYEQIHDSVPFYTDNGRLSAYCDLSEAIEYGENLISHREGVEATPYLPNVIVSSSPYLRPQSYGVAPGDLDADRRTIRNIKLPWSKVKRTVNPLWKQGFHFFCSTPKSRHTTHSSWSTVDWHWMWSSDFGDPERADKRAPGVGDRQIQMNPAAAKDAGLAAGDYVYVDSNPADRPFVGAEPGDPRTKAFRCMVRLKLNPSLPYHMTIMKHTGWIATERTVKAHESRPDGRALAEDTGYQSSYRYGSHQSITRSWLPPMHQTDTLFHKKTGGMGFVFGFAIDNHGVNTVPKETLVRITKAESGGLGGVGEWPEGKKGSAPGNESDEMRRYLSGSLIKIG